jgi:hypothetical protein
MKRQWFIVGFGTSARSPRAARLSLAARRSAPGLGVGCPSFGGQRAVGGGSCFPFAGLVTAWNRVGVGKVAGFWRVNLARPEHLACGPKATFGRSSCGARRLHNGAGPTENSRMKQPPGSARSCRSSAHRMVHRSAVGWPAVGGRSLAPNRSLEWTSTSWPHYVSPTGI